MALASASSSPAPSTASTAAAALAVAALASRRAAPAAGGRLSRAGLPPRPDVAASPTAPSSLRSLLSPRPAGVAALSALDVAHTAPDRAPGLLDGGLGCLPSPACADAAPASAAPSTPTAAVAPMAATPAPPAAALAALAAVPSAGASASLLLPPSSSAPVHTDLETEALLRPSYGQLRVPAQVDGGAGSSNAVAAFDAGRVGACDRCGNRSAGSSQCSGRGSREVGLSSAWSIFSVGMQRPLYCHRRYCSRGGLGACGSGATFRPTSSPRAVEGRSRA
ncbi:hypothetical protein VPH35_000727 [Triticum aestivum]